MTAIQFYHLTATPVERALPKLVEKAYSTGERVLLVDGSERLDSFNQLLWTYSSLTFLPHGKAGDPQAAEQPILLAPTPQNDNHAKILLVTDGSTVENTESFTRILDIFDGKDDEAVAEARTRWKTYQNGGHALTYMRQTEKGNWEEKKLA